MNNANYVKGKGKKMDKQREGFFRKNKRKIVWIASIYLMLSMSGALLLPELLRGWSLNRLINGYLLVLTGGLGIGGLFLLWKFSHVYQMNCKKEFLIKWGIGYLLIQMILSIMIGGIGVLLINSIAMHREMVEIGLYYFSGVLQNIIRGTFLCFWFFQGENSNKQKNKLARKIVFLWWGFFTIIWLGIGIMLQSNIPTILEILWNGCYMIGLYIVLKTKV